MEIVPGSKDPDFLKTPPIDSQMVKELWTVDDLAHWARVPRSWVYSHCHELPKVKIGHLLRFDPDEIKRHFTAKTRPGRGKS
jgi:hypothetical protein